MIIVASYHVDTAMYFSSETRHNLVLSTTEYTYKSNMLVHVQIGKNTAIRLNNLLRYEFKLNENFQSEQFLFGKTYDSGHVKTISQSVFDEKMRRFDMGQTVIAQEILEDYTYTDKAGGSDSVQVVVKERNLTMTAGIDFRDAEQYNRFAYPAWLMPLYTEYSK